MNKINDSVQAYKKFMWNEQNKYNRSECPENCLGEYRGCGQQHCWVTVHLQSRKEYEEEG